MEKVHEFDLWQALAEHAGKPFVTSGRPGRPGIEFTYTIRGNEMFVSTKVKSITKATVLIAYRQAIEIQASEGYVRGPKKIGCFGSSYLYAIFIRLGICTPIPTDLLG